jgi:hypothetical protein
LRQMTKTSALKGPITIGDQDSRFKRRVERLLNATSLAQITSNIIMENKEVLDRLYTARQVYRQR